MNKPSRDYIAMLDIKAVVRKWQDLEIKDREALRQIERIYLEVQKAEWKENH